MTVAILCADEKTNYSKISNLEIYDRERDAYSFRGGMPVVCHPPCAQWSNLKHFAHKNQYEKDLAPFCWSALLENGGIFEHPICSTFIKNMQPLPKECKMISVDLHWFGYRARKRTALIFHRCKPLALPLNFNAVTHMVGKGSQAYKKKSPLKGLWHRDAHETPPSMVEWLINSIRQTYQPKQ